ncbi:MAG: hypothetical protein KDK89_23400, partial [Alphaproteobacteria bacterium]|nr:hypothetical protein [Alphaproteobacteria bacterium]
RGVGPDHRKYHVHGTATGGFHFRLTRSAAGRGKQRTKPRMGYTARARCSASLSGVVHRADRKDDQA